MDIHSLSRSAAQSRTLRNMSWRQRVKIIVFAAPVLFTLATLGFAIESGLYVLRSQETTGTVVQRYEWPGETIFDRGTTNYEPIFTYQLEGGPERRASVGSSHSSFDYAVGEMAQIRAIPGGNGNVRVATWQGLWFIPAMLSLFMLGNWIVALLLWGLVRRFWRDPKAS